MDKDSLVTGILNDVMKLTEADKAEEAYRLVAEFVSAHPDAVDNRFRAELAFIMKNMEYKNALKEFSFLRGLSVVYKYCGANYAKVLQEQPEYGTELLPDRDVIWWCWLQSLEKAPEIVRCCYESVKKLGKKIIVLDEGNLTEYVSLPDHIIEKYNRGIISRTHYTDLVRMELLTERGGLWLDATAYISGTASILPVLDAEDLFMYRSGNVSEYIIFDSWFMQAGRKSAIFEATKKLLYTYWEKEEELKHYFLLHLMMTLACKMYPDEFESIPLFSNEPAHALQHDMFKAYSEKRWVQIKNMSDVHKLTYKYDDGDIGGSLLEKILKGTL
ncbi:MAG: capsular polysaccharide synthesis protein [Lachnospiraceae bacterium]|nr:capsular polysaccharide synthesis protein [Lachnospiraceae bacterium]